MDKNVLQEWLKFAVALAEIELGSGTGQKKLRYVYNLALERFPGLEKFITFDDFSKLVDIALKWLKDQLGMDKTKMENYVAEVGDKVG